MSPVEAASWCAITTSVRSASRSPVIATTFWVGSGLRQPAAEDAAGVGDVVGDRRARQRGEHAAGEPAASALSASMPGQRGDRGERPDRLGVAVVVLGGLDLRFAAGFAQPLGDPVCRLGLTGEPGARSSGASRSITSRSAGWMVGAPIGRDGTGALAMVARRCG